MDPVMKQQLIFAGLLLAALLSISGITVLWPSNLSIRGAELQHADSNTGNSAPEGYKLMLAQVVFRCALHACPPAYTPFVCHVTCCNHHNLSGRH